MSKDYEVGYGKPPQHSRFQQGQSGNRKGRPKKQRNTGTLIREILEEPVTITIKGKQKKVSSRAAILLRLREKALSGDLRSISTLFSLQAAHQSDPDDTQLFNLSEQDKLILHEAGFTDLAGGKDAS